jgi:nitronate monooxygenase
MDVALTSRVTGRLARGARNRLMTELGHADVPPYPVMNALTSELRRAAASQDNPDLMSLWCGQGAPLAGSQPAADMVRDIAAAIAAIAAELHRAASLSSSTA